MRLVLPWLLLASIASAEPQFEYSLSEALRHPDQVRALRFKSSDWPVEPGYIQCLGFVGLGWPKVLERFHNLEVLEVADSRGGVFSLWTGPCPLPKLRRLSFEGASLGLWSNHYDLGNLRELELRNCHAHLGMPNQSCSLQADHLEKLELELLRAESSSDRGVPFAQPEPGLPRQGFDA